jgi:recombinational DNA repair ATPase RecF
MLHRRAEGSDPEPCAGQAARLARAEASPSPILLLDEVAAHLDARRRGALFDEIEALGCRPS